MYPNDDTSLTVEQKWVVGDTFLQNFYSIFDWQQKKVGLIPPKGSEQKKTQTANKKPNDSGKNGGEPPKNSEKIQTNEDDTLSSSMSLDDSEPPAPRLMDDQW